ncbi:V-type ATP synthase subunit F [Ignisphaera sp. 4213-co]|uniref:V-type ATP synthase subunit F n=1 Tax=Ignisphaera cupida TaxID=3050454 RepID=A0ABD4Z5T2_9CREN|nr:V-type ATP synthase subunit F [Ignisphaera sp. 4213-co]MDK6027993.1 V-type ATP synthase subunit F [Ignisphaera sp. 4213-co]
MSLPKEFVKGICAIVKKEFEPLMRMLGIKEVYTVNNWGEAKNFLDKLATRNDLAIVAVQKSLVPAEISFIDLNLQRLYPIVVLIPDDKKDLFESLKVFYRELIRRYIGYEIHLE